MKRSSFLKGLATLPAMGLLSFETFTQYEKVYLKQVFVRGFSYYEGPRMIDEINKTGQLELVREPNNSYDKRAIALYFNQKKIGFLPQESNKTMSILMDTSLLEFHAEVTHIAPDASDWEKIRIAVYALKKIENQEDLQKIEPYAALITPNYYSLKSEGHTVTKFTSAPTPPKHEEQIKQKPEEKEEQTVLNLGVFVQKDIYSPRYDITISVLFTEFDSILDIEKTMLHKGEFTHTEMLPTTLDEVDLANNLISKYIQSGLYPDDFGVFAVNVNKLNFKNHSIKEMHFLTNQHNIDFLEVNIEKIDWTQVAGSIRD